MKRAVLTAAVLASFAACNYRVNSVPPEEAASRFAADLGIQVQGKPSCAGVDTDGDGYVSCTLAVAPAASGAAPTMLSLDCAGVTNAFGACGAQTDQYAVGCKEKQPKIAVPRRD